MTATLADVPRDQLAELAFYLEKFCPTSKASCEDGEDDSDQYWSLLARTLRAQKNVGQEFKYDEHKLAQIGGKKNSAELFLDLLVKKKLNFEIFISCLKEINCRKALNIFTRASAPIIKNQSVVGEITVAYEGTITVSVSAECQPGPLDYQWFKDQRNILRDQTTKTLLLHNASTNDTGHYHCRVTNPSLNDYDSKKNFAFSEYVHVIVSPPTVVNKNPTVRQEMGSSTPTLSLSPLITLHPASVKAAQGNQVKLECRAERAVCYDWYRNDKIIRSEARQGMLVLATFSATDVGEYFCVVVNDHGRVRSRVVTVELGSSLALPQEARIRSESIVFEEQPPESLDVHVGEDIVLTCRARSRSGEVTYNWVQVDQSGKEKEEVNKSNQSPIYQAKTGNSNIKRRLKLTMYCRVSLVNDPQVVAESRATKVTINTVWFTKHPQSIERALIGDKATLSASAEGVGDISYIWFRSSTKDGNFQPIRNQQSNKLGVLYFNRLRQNDWGYYNCQAGNTSHFVQSKTVCVRPTIPSMKRSNLFKRPLIRIKKNPWSQIVPEGGRFKLMCEAVCSEDVPLDYQWYYCGKTIHGATEFTYIRDPTQEGDCGPYYCEVKCANNPVVKPEFSKTARIELAPDNGLSEAVDVGKFPASRLQLKGEEVFRTKKEERYAREKVALLIGNQNYQCDDLNNLRSPEHDIRQLRDLLEDKLGFKVISLLDLTHAEMMRALEFFYEMLAIPGVYALFYYSGHGFITTAKKNFLIPVNAILPLKCDTNINADVICNQMRKKLSRAVVVLDCCRVETRIDESLSSFSLDSLPDSEAEDDHINVANYLLITSCQEGNRAYDGHETELSPAATPSVHSKSLPLGIPERFPCSNFNIAFRDALSVKKKLNEVVDHVMITLRDLESKQKYNRAGMRPTVTQSLMDTKITLHDDVFMDNSDDEPKLEKIIKLHEEVHYVPGMVMMESHEEIGELSDLAQLELSFSYDFTNVLCVHTRLHLLHGDKTTKACVEYDISFLEGQGVFGDQTKCSFDSPLDDSDVGGQGESPQLISTIIRISSIQRLRSEVLKLFMTLSVYTEGKEISAKVMYEFPKKPLFANLQ